MTPVRCVAWMGGCPSTFFAGLVIGQRDAWSLAQVGVHSGKGMDTGEEGEGRGEKGTGL